jgi:hypothetical protein
VAEAAAAEEASLGASGVAGVVGVALFERGQTIKSVNTASMTPNTITHCSLIPLFGVKYISVSSSSDPVDLSLSAGFFFAISPHSFLLIGDLWKSFHNL